MSLSQSYNSSISIVEKKFQIPANKAGEVDRATDNIAIERFWRSAKVERIYLNQYNTQEKSVA